MAQMPQKQSWNRAMVTKKAEVQPEPKLEAESSPSNTLTPDQQAVLELIQPTEADMAALVPCIRLDCDGGLPFLNCNPNWKDPHKTSFWVKCPKCGAAVCDTGSFSNAIALWVKSFNFARRAELPAEAALEPS